MTDITTSIPQAVANPDVAAGTAQFLSPVVVDLTAIVVNGKQAHWHVRGANFIGVHELLDDIVEHAQEWADLAAERIVALGLPVDARLSTVAAKTSTPELSEGFQQSDRTIAEVIALIDAASASVNTAVDELDELDQTSQDIAIEIARGLDKDRWFLFAHLSR
ncbi:DNA starvation/stationary phase protection protein [Plantibacter sp. PA-3-X8]|uniref:Starvation-inducible DNA-binding protein n=1 Tax=Plantibacter flavus TaxID=150123 RepID=A0A3N2C286_9MICO|nr:MULTISPECIES: DNA starvation/stationary phase protection protein [Plantibacter]AZH83617.1 DNA starvation/stationary phase protection protein [Plantibacter sp. PA-3-X8]MDD9152769.1 DNA starvation/stationary phase protection protein [Plantibacter flavus]ROR81560.1 starvation-inducible DNA-binding protein [Plantibacter flavus]SMG14207.1 starvation-inducible DNA-binding protein [Plantibacter flavus]